MEIIPIVRRLIFPAPQPPNYDYDSYPDATIWIPTTPPYADIPCIFIPYRDADSLMVFAHGNGCDIGSMYDTLHFYSRSWKTNVLLFEYPGYGSCLGTPSEESINHNMDAVYAFIRDVLKWPNDRIILYGQSIGTGPTCQLASRLNQQGVHLGGIILQSPYTTLQGVVQFLAGSIASKLIKTNFNNLECMNFITDPILIIHGVKDEIIPTHHSETLFEKSISQRKHLLVVNSATHNHFDHHHDIIAPIQQFLQCYLRTPARYPNNHNQAALAAQAKAKELTEEAKADTGSNENGSDVPAAASSTPSAAPAVASSSSSPPTSAAVESSPPAYFVHHPPASPMPPSTLKIEKKYFAVPQAVVQAYLHRIEQARRSAESRARNSERKAAVKGFFSGLGSKIASASQAVISKVSGTLSPLEQQSDGASSTSSSSASSSAPALPPRGAKHASNGTLLPPIDMSKTTDLPPPSPQRQYSPAAARQSRAASEDPMQSPSSESDLPTPKQSPTAAAASSAIRKRPEEDSFTISDTPQREDEDDESVDI